MQIIVLKCGIKFKECYEIKGILNQLKSRVDWLLLKKSSIILMEIIDFGRR